MNECGEIPIAKPELVRPECQVQMMNWMRVNQGLAPYTEKEIQEILKTIGEKHEPAKELGGV